MTFQSPARKSLLQTAQHGQARLGFADAPLRGQRLLQAAEVARGVVHVGLGDLDIMQANDRIDVDRMRLRALADDLAMHLALGRHVDDEIAQDARLAAESAARRQRAALVDIALLHRAPRRHMIFRGIERVLGEFALGDVDLTAPADAAAAADRVEIDAEFARDLQHAGAVGDFVAFARRREDDPMRTQFLSPATRPTTGRLWEAETGASVMSSIPGGTSLLPQSGRRWREAPDERRSR